MRKMMLLGAMSLAAATIGAVYTATSTDMPKPDAPDAPPTRVERRAEKPAPAVAAAEEPKKEAVATNFGVLRLQRAFDVDLADFGNFFWSPDGKQIAIEGTTSGINPQGSILIYPVENRPAVISCPLEPRTNLVGFSPDGSQFITELHEFNLVSGRHELSFRANQVPCETQRTVMLDSERTFGYSFAPDGKTYRTVAREVRPGPKRPVVGERYHEIDSKLWVREVSTTTGRTLRTLLSLQGEFTSYMLSGDGKKLVVGEKDGIAIHDIATGKRKFTPIAASPPLPRQGPMPFGPELTAAPPFGNGEELQPAPKMRERPINVAISPDGKVVFAYRDEDSPVLVDGETGKLLAKLEGAERISSTFDIGAGNFSAESRLIAVVGFRWNKDESTQTSTQQHFLSVWDCRTGKLVKSWPTLVSVAFHPTKPILAILERNDKKTRVGLWDFSAEISEATQADKKAATPEELVTLIEAAQKTDNPRAGLAFLGGPHRTLNVQAVEVLEAAKAFDKALDDKFGKDPNYRPLFPQEFKPVKRVELKGMLNLGGGKIELTIWTVRDEVIESRELAIRENGGWVLLAPVPFTHSTSMEEIRTVDGRAVKVQVMSPPKELTPNELAAARTALPRARALLERGAKDVAAGKHATRKAAVTAVETEATAVFEPGQGKSAGTTNPK